MGGSGMPGERSRVSTAKGEGASTGSVQKCRQGGRSPLGGLVGSA